MAKKIKLRERVIAKIVPRNFFLMLICVKNNKDYFTVILKHREKGDYDRD